MWGAERIGVVILAARWTSPEIVDTPMRARIDRLDELLGEPLDPHTYYSVIGASAMVFDVEFECRRFARLGLHVLWPGERPRRSNESSTAFEAGADSSISRGSPPIYEMLDQQPKAAWSHEIDVRTNMERFRCGRNDSFATSIVHVYNKVVHMNKKENWGITTAHSAAVLRCRRMEEFRSMQRLAEETE